MNIKPINENDDVADFEGKKLLILGGNPETTPLVEIANSMGIKTIVTSGRGSDPAKKVAWKAYDVDGMDVPALIHLARTEKVDGVLVGVADVLVPSYCELCKVLDLPCYATREIVDVFSFKVAYVQNFSAFYTSDVFADYNRVVTETE